MTEREHDDGRCCENGYFGQAHDCRKGTDTPEQAAREWFINPVACYICEVNENDIGLTGNEIHVIEKSAYDAFAVKYAELKHAYDYANIWQLTQERDELVTQFKFAKSQWEMTGKLLEQCRAVVDDLSRENARLQFMLKRLESNPESK